MGPPPSKRRKTSGAATKPAEISFDFDARHDFLTGFRKRKQQRIQHAKDVAAEQDRVARIDARKEAKEQRRRDLDAHLKAVDDVIRAQNGVLEAEKETDQEVDEGQEDGHEKENDSGREDEYVDEEKYTTVTVESMHRPESESESESQDGSEGKSHTANTSVPATKAEGSKSQRHNATKKVKKPKKKFRYESKEERKATRDKQKSRKIKAAKARRE